MRNYDAVQRFYLGYSTIGTTEPKEAELNFEKNTQTFCVDYTSFL